MKESNEARNPAHCAGEDFSVDEYSFGTIMDFIIGCACKEVNDGAH